MEYIRNENNERKGTESGPPLYKRDPAHACAVMLYLYASRGGSAG